MTQEKQVTLEGIGKSVKNMEDILTGALELIEKLSGRMDTFEKGLTSVEKKASGKATGLFGGKREKTAIKDTKTGILYSSKAAVGKKLAAEFGADPGDHFAWYKIQAKAPDRFINATPEEAAKIWAEDKAAQDKKIEESNKRLAEEEAAKAKAEADAAAAAAKAAAQKPASQKK